jgi:hypothetical protein
MNVVVMFDDESGIRSYAAWSLIIPSTFWVA